ncbi:hypothetical protein BJX65DRAFT_286167 [Aspergillus insuetus]
MRRHLYGSSSARSCEGDSASPSSKGRYKRLTGLDRLEQDATLLASVSRDSKCWEAEG